MNSLKYRYVRAISDMLKNINIGDEFLECANIKEKVEFVVHKKMKIIDSMDIELDSPNYCMFIFINDLLEYGSIEENSDNKDAKNQVMKQVEDKVEENLNKECDFTLYDNAYIFFIFSKLQDEILFKSICGSAKEFKDDIVKALNKKFAKGKIEYKLTTIVKNNHEKFNIKIDSRVKSLNVEKKIDIDEETEKELSLNGYVFTANLYDLVELYNNLGSDLFNNNVRFNIKDELDVDSNIIKTLRNNPSDFWYLNNGISMIIEDDNFMLRKEKVLEISCSKNTNISIINGAQTISASAEFFFNPLNSNDEEKKRAKEDAKVILKLMHFRKNDDSISKRYIGREIDKVSIGLNRQKPIKAEDVAYTQPFVYEINRLENEIDKEYYFSINRRGENEETGIGIADFAQIVEAYLCQEPGVARNGPSKLLKLKFDVENGEYNFEEEDIFKGLNENSEITKEAFMKYYKPVNFAKELEGYYSRNIAKIKKDLKNKKEKLEKELVDLEPERKRLEKELAYIKNKGKKVKVDKQNLLDKQIEKIKQLSEEIQTYNKKIAIASYGKWFFISYLVYEINGYKVDDFTNFSYLTKDYYRSCEIIYKFINVYNSFFENKNKFDVNEFKNSNLYKNFLKHMNNNRDLAIINEAQDEVAATIAD